MKTTYTAPSISSVAENEIVDLASIGLYLPQLRLVQLKGVPIRLTIQKEKYIELNSTEEEVDISKYYDCLKDVMSFFYGVAHIYAYVDDGKLFIYDIFTNDNYLSTRDMNYLEQIYHIPIVKPIAEGTFTFSYLVEILNKKINGEGIEADSLHILPCMYLDDGRTYTSSAPKVTTNIVVGEKPKPVVATPVTKTVAPTTVPVGTLTEVKTPIPSVIEEPEIFRITTKEERTAVYKEVLKNVNDYVEKNKIQFSALELKWWKEHGMKFAHAYAIHTLPKTRHIVYDYCKQFGGVVAYYGLTNYEKWAELFYYLFEDEYSDSLLKGHSFSSDWVEADKFAAIFKEEFEEFDKFYVAENDVKDDWRYSYTGGIY